MNTYEDLRTVSATTYLTELLQNGLRFSIDIRKEFL